MNDAIGQRHLSNAANFISMLDPYQLTVIRALLQNSNVIMKLTSTRDTPAEFQILAQVDGGLSINIVRTGDVSERSASAVPSTKNISKSIT